MRRREFITLLGGAAAGWPLTVRAQQRPKIPRVGIIDDGPVWNAFRQGLRDLGYLEGQNIAFEYRYGDGLPDRLAEVAADLVRRPVDVIAVYGTPPARAAKQATSKIPIVMIGIGDPVGAGLVTSLARPGENITGNTILGPDVASKRLQLLKEGVPASRVALLWNPDNASHAAYLEEMRIAASTLNVTLIPVPVRNASEFDGAFAAMMHERPDAFVMTADPLHQLRIKRIVDFLAQNRLRGDVPAERECGCRRAHVLWREPPRPVSARRLVRAPDFAGHQARGFAGGKGASSSWSSTSRPPRRLASRSRNRSSCAPTR